MREPTNTELLILLMKLLPNQTIEGRTRLQKLVFLLKEMDVSKFSYEFVQYHYGPYSADLQNAINLLTGLNVLSENREEEAGKTKYTYSLTKYGTDLSDKIEKELSRKVDIQESRKFLRRLSSIPTDELILLSKYIWARNHEKRESRPVVA